MPITTFYQKFDIREEKDYEVNKERKILRKRKLRLKCVQIVFCHLCLDFLAFSLNKTNKGF